MEAPRIVPLGSYDNDARAKHETSATAFISLLPNQIIAAMLMLTILWSKAADRSTKLDTSTKDSAKHNSEKSGPHSDCGAQQLKRHAEEYSKVMTLQTQRF